VGGEEKVLQSSAVISRSTKGCYCLERHRGSKSFNVADSQNDLVAHLKQKTVTADEQKELTEQKRGLDDQQNDFEKQALERRRDFQEAKVAL
jgi:hypothetical protein